MHYSRRLAGYSLIVLLAQGVGISMAAPLGPAFTFQGRLAPDGGGPPPASVNLDFRLFDAATLGNQIGNPDVEINTPLTNGLFSVSLNDTNQFGVNPFIGQARWIEVRVNGVPLTTRQPVTAAPYASYSLAAKTGNALDALDGTPANAVFVDNTGNVGIGTTSPAGKLDVPGKGYFGTGTNGENHKLVIRGPNSPTNPASYQDLSYEFSAAGSAKVRAYRGGSWDTYLQFLTNSYGRGFDSPIVRMHINENGAVGIGTTTPNFPLSLGTSLSHTKIALYDASATNHYGLGVVAGQFSFHLNGAGARYAFYDSDDLTNEIFTVFGNGTTRVKVLQIMGADVAEKFPVSEQVEPGKVVEIDPDHPGQLRLSRGAYNRRVAGVVSGANGLSTGAILGNLPGHEDAPAIALTGRVWVNCVTSNGPIEPGDLLTTSDTSGHAMKVADYARAQGAVLGKAMTALSEENGLVLVLVSLQ